MELPIKFKNRMKEYLGREYNDFLLSFDDENVKAFHLNTSRISCEEFESVIDSLSNDLYSIKNIQKIENSKNLYYYSSEKIGSNFLSHAGAIYSQDPSAMMPINNIPFELEGSEIVLDLCASPGGKSSQIAMQLAKSSGILVCNEVNPARNKVLVSNIERMGYKNILVTKKYPNEIEEDYPSYFDIIIVDAPCSGEGMFRKYPDSINEWSLENVNMCALRQQEILQSAVNMLKPGGHLIYSTCTYSIEEDENMVEYIEKLGLKLIPVNGMPYVKCYPHKYKGEGQFYAYFSKPGNLSSTNLTAVTSFIKPISNKTNEIIHEALKDTFNYIDVNFYELGSNIIILPKEFVKFPKHQITHAGAIAGTIEKNRFIPHHQLFHTYGQNFKSKFDISNNATELYKYLHGEELISENVSNGYGVITYKHIPIGGFKASNNRLKNHYPKGLRNM